MDNLVGQRFGRLTVTDKDEPNRWGQARYRCICECGSTKTIHGGSMTSGRTRSCGCLAADANRKRMCLPWGETEKNCVISGYSKSAARRGLCYELTKEQFLELASKNCVYCGAAPGNLITSPHGEDKGTYTYNGLDRVDNDKGYTIDNVVPCCKNCNYAKRKIPIDEFLSWVASVYRHSIQPQEPVGSEG